MGQIYDHNTNHSWTVMGHELMLLINKSVR